MDHYKELLEQLRNIVNHGDEQPAEYCTNRCGGCDACDKSIDAIETLLAERDAAIADIERDCKTCIHYKSNTRGHIPCDVMDSCIFSNHWQWRGPQKHD